MGIVSYCGLSFSSRVIALALSLTLLCSGYLASGEAAQESPQKEIDLLTLIDPNRDAVQSGWSRDASGLVCTPAPYSLLEIPHSPPREYDLALTAERLGDPEGLAIGLVAEGIQFAVVLDGWRGEASGVHRVARRGADANETTFRGRLFEPGKAVPIVCRVRTGRLLVSVGDRTVIDWTTNYRNASNDDDWSVTRPDSLYLATFSTSYRISRLTLTPVSGEGRPMTEKRSRTARLGGSGGGPFEDLAPSRGVLVALRVALAPFGSGTIIKAIEPAYRVGDELKRGRVHGRPSDEAKTLMARPGYAVGGLVAKTGARVDGFRVIFMKIASERLDPKDSYESEWVGGRGGGPETRLVSDGRPFSGIYGREGDDLDALGLAYGPFPIDKSLLEGGEVSPEEVDRFGVMGSRISQDYAAALEGLLAEKPQTLRVRIALMGYHACRGGESGRSGGRYADLVVGLVEHHSKLDLAFEISRFLNPPGFQKGATQWLAAAKANPADPKILGHAGAYLTFNLYVEDFRDQGQKLLLEARRLDPRNPRWPLYLGEGAHVEFIRERSKEAAAKALGHFEEAWELSPEKERPALRPGGQHLYHVLSNLALAAGKPEKAEKYAARLLEVVTEKEESWNYGNAIHEANIVLGRTALWSGKTEEARKFLLAAGRTPGSPQLNSFGPSMELAEELLKKGERETVLQYFELCRKFWNNPDAIERLDEWTKGVREGKTPKFSEK